MSSTSWRSQCGSGSSRSSSYWTEVTEDLQYPFYPYVDHPLVYYAQVPEPCGFKQRIRDKKDNPNCFVRAFRWYTQEHNVKNSSANEKPVDTAGFANWLDHKYDQFLNDGCHHSVVARQRVSSSVRIVSNKPCKLKADKYKKPWGRRRATSSRNGGDCHPGKHQSFEIILQPKNLSHPASECCLQNRQATCCETRATVASSDTEVMSRNSKLQNYATVIDGNELRVRPVPENAKVLRLQDDETLVLTRTLNSASSFHVKRRDVSCQCPEEQAGTAEASTQYDPDDFECGPPTLEQPVKTEQETSPELQSIPTKTCECRDLPVVKDENSTQCFQEESPKVLELNSDTETKKAIIQGKDMASLLRNPEMKSSEAVNSQRQEMCVCESLQNTQNSQVKTTECNTCKACKNNHEAESKKNLQEEKIESNEAVNTLQLQSTRKMSAMSASLRPETCCTIQPQLKSAVCDLCKTCPLNHNAEAFTNQREDQPELTTSALSERRKMTSNERIMQTTNVKIHSSTQLAMSESKTSGFDVCRPCGLNSKITDTKITSNQNNMTESSIGQQAKVKSRESNSKTSTVCPAIKVISECRHLPPESKCAVCKTCKVKNFIPTATYKQEKVKYDEKKDAPRPSLKTSVICACPKVNNFSSTQQSQPESKIPECKVCKINKNIEIIKTVCDQEKIINEWKPAENSLDTVCKCPQRHNDVNQCRKVLKMTPTRQATAQTSDYSICLGKSLPSGLPLLVQVVAKR